MNRFHVIIPARFHSTRLPEKPLAKIGDRSMILHVCEKAKQSGASSITVATDHLKILEEVKNGGYHAVMTRADHPSGSDRLYEAAELIGLNDDDIIVNVQGDEPFIPANNISQVASLLSLNAQNIDLDCENKICTQNQMSTLCCQMQSAEEVLDPNAVKVIFNTQGSAIYFSRSVIPYDRNHPLEAGRDLKQNYYRHIGIYAYRKAFLQQFIRWQPSQLETTECLEQLRVIENGFGISIACLDNPPPHGVDTESDLLKAQKYYLEQVNGES